MGNVFQKDFFLPQNTQVTWYTKVSSSACDGSSSQ